MSSPTLQISTKNTFLNFSESPRPTFRKAKTFAPASGTESPYSLASTISFLSPNGDSTMSLSSPYALSPTDSLQKTKVLDTYVASVGECQRTTVMVRGIPKNYEQNMFLAE